MYFEKHHLFLKPFYQLVMFVDFRFLHFLYKFGIFRERGAFSIFFFPSILVLVAKIRYSTSKMTPLTISLLQLISNLSGIGISTIPDYRGPIRAPKRPKKTTIFPSIFVFVNNITYSTPKMTPFTISLLLPISNLSGIGISIIPDHRGPHQSPKAATNTPQKNCFLSIFVFVADIRYSTPKITTLTISLLQPLSNLSGIGVSAIDNHQGPHQSPKTATNTPKKQLFPKHLCFCG